MKKKITAILLSVVLFFSVFASFGASVFAASAKIEIDKDSLVQTYDGTAKVVTTNVEDYYSIYVNTEAFKPVVRFNAQESLQEDMKTSVKVNADVQELTKNAGAVVAFITGDYLESFNLTKFKEDRGYSDAMYKVLASVTEYIYPTANTTDQITFDGYKFLCIANNKGLLVKDVMSLLDLFSATFPMVARTIEALDIVKAQVGWFATIELGTAPVDAGLYLAVVVGTWPGAGKGSVDAGIMTIKPAEATIKFKSQDGEKAAVFAKDSVDYGAYVDVNGNGVQDETENTSVYSVFTGAKDEGNFVLASPKTPKTPGVYQQMAYVTGLVGDGNYYVKPVFRTVIVVRDLKQLDDPDTHLEDGRYVVIPGYSVEDGKQHYDPQAAYIVDPKTGEVTQKPVTFDQNKYDGDMAKYLKYQAYNKATTEATFVRTVRNAVTKVLGWFTKLNKYPSNLFGVRVQQPVQPK